MTLAGRPPPVPWEVLSEETLYQDRWRRLRRDRLRLHTGETSSYVYLETAAAVFVVPQLEDGRLVLLRQYRHPLRAWVWEVPAGGLEAGETPEEAAVRELAEETGGVARVWQRLGVFPTAVAHLVDQTTYLLAQGITLGPRCQELHEVAELHLVLPEAALRLVHGAPDAGAGGAEPVVRFSAHSALALLLAEPYLRR